MFKIYIIVRTLLFLRLRQNSKSTKFDKKYLVFGEKEEEGEETHILGIIKKTLREALDGLLTNAEVNLRKVFTGTRIYAGADYMRFEGEICCVPL